MIKLFIDLKNLEENLIAIEIDKNNNIPSNNFLYPYDSLNEKGDKASDKDFEDVFNKDIDLKEKGIAIEREYFAKMKAVIPVSKIAKLHQAEREFKRHMLKNLKEGRPNHHQKMEEKKAE